MGGANRRRLWRGHSGCRARIPAGVGAECEKWGTVKRAGRKRFLPSLLPLRRELTVLIFPQLRPEPGDRGMPARQARMPAPQVLFDALGRHVAAILMQGEQRSVAFAVNFES